VSVSKAHCHCLWPNNTQPLFLSILKLWQ